MKRHNLLPLFLSLIFSWLVQDGMTHEMPPASVLQDLVESSNNGNKNNEMEPLDLLIFICTQSFTAEGLVEDVLLDQIGETMMETNSYWKVKATLVDEMGLDWAVLNTPQHQTEQEFELGSLAKHILIVASTYGDGDPPNHATQFADWLVRVVAQQSEQPNQQQQQKQQYPPPTFSVFGLGDTTYQHFNAFATFVDQHLGTLLGSQQRMLPVAMGDTLDDLPAHFTAWSQQVLRQWMRSMPWGNAPSPEVQQKAHHALFSSTGTDWRRSALEPDTVKATMMGRQELLSLQQKQEQPSTTTNNQTWEDDDRSVLHISFNVPIQKGIRLQPGDYLAVYPQNDATIVDKALEWLFLKDRPVYTKIVEKHPLSGTWVEKRIGAQQLLTEHVDLAGRASPAALRALLPFVGTLELRALARDLTAIVATNKNETSNLAPSSSCSSSSWDHWLAGRWLTKLDLAILFECRPSLQALARAMGPMQPRMYSIATATIDQEQTNQQRIGLCVAIAKGGLCTNYLTNMQMGGMVHVVPRANDKFHYYNNNLHLPAKHSPPTYLVAAGSGMGPYVGFLENHLASLAGQSDSDILSRPLSNVHLLFGSRGPADFLYKDKWVHMERLGVNLHLAYSRVPSQPKRYAPTLLLEQEMMQGVWDNLLSKNASTLEGRMYVCGRLEICINVKQALVQIARYVGGLSEVDAFQRVIDLEEEGRMLTDCWSVSDVSLLPAATSVELPPRVVSRLERHHGSGPANQESILNDIDLEHIPAWPSYLRMAASGELDRRIENATAMHSACVACGRFCEVDRLSPDPQDWGECRVGEKAIVFARDAHFGEESVLKGTHGSGTIFFGACNLKCIYCQNWKLSMMDQGELVDEYQLADMMLELQEWGTHNINFVSPTHNVLAILRAVRVAAHRGLRLPLVWNTGGYDSVASLRVLEGIIDIYMPDAKYASRKVARKLSQIDNYPEINQAAIKEMHRQVGSLQIDPRTGLAYRGVLVRHLVLPNDYAGTMDVASFLTNEISVETYTHVMDYYRPEYEAANDKKYGLNRKPTRKELDDAHKRARCACLKRIHGEDEKDYPVFGLGGCLCAEDGAEEYLYGSDAMRRESEIDAQTGVGTC